MPVPVPIVKAWSCGVVPGHEHASEAEAWACIRADDPPSVYGYCPVCGAPGVLRERRPGGNDQCQAGHTYPSSAAV